jgi:hypothetical protein
MAKRVSLKKSRTTGTRGGVKPATVTFRTSNEVADLLVASAKANKRTLSAECEVQLQRGLSSWEKSETLTIMTLISVIVDTVMNVQPIDVLLGDESLRRPPGKWWQDPYLYARTERLVIDALRAFRPRGEPPEISEHDLKLGTAAYVMTVLEMQTVDDKPPFEKQTVHQRRLNRLREDLGLLADRPAISNNMTAAEIRAQHEKMKSSRDELVSLTRKAAAAERKKAPGLPLTKQEAARLAELEAEIKGTVRLRG